MTHQRTSGLEVALLDPMSSSTYPPVRASSPNAMLKRAFSLPITQMAWREERRGPPEQCLEQKKVPVMHDLAPGEVLVKIEAAALNPVYVATYILMKMTDGFAEGIS
jgi:hypothetical protein